MTTLRLNRDSVAMSDDAESHERSVEVDAHQPFIQFLQDIRALGYLAYVGSRATWLVVLEEVHERFVEADAFEDRLESVAAVVAEQWPEPALLVPEGFTLGELLGEGEWGLHFIYWAQADPAAVMAAVRAGEPLPDRYG